MRNTFFFSKKGGNFSTPSTLGLETFPGWNFLGVNLYGIGTFPEVNISGIHTSYSNRNFSHINTEVKDKKTA